MSAYLINAPINNLSFGNVSFNILKEFYRSNKDIGIFPIGDSIQNQAFDKAPLEFIQYLQTSVDARYDKIAKDAPTLKLWHVQGAESRLSRNQTLFTFHETSEITKLEKNVLNCQDKIIVTSNYTKDIFEKNGVENVHFTPLGFDEDFCVVNKNDFVDKIHFGLIGKFEHRKNTSRIIKIWLKLFGNNSKYLLSCAVTNPFMQKAVLQNEILKALGGQQYGNINFVPHMQTNSEVNDFINAIDIDLGGLSGSEGWNLPSFNATALGKWSIVLNATAHKDWATKDNSILIEPSGMKDCYDGIFFKKGNSVNQGQFFDLSDKEIEEAIVKSVAYAKRLNTEGLKLQQKFTYKNTFDKIMQII
jgi:hypothetical protein